MPSTDPVYNLGAVLKMTGLHGDTLRAWERRYGIPMPKRTPGRQRLYSERDVRIITWLVDRQSQGMTISGAVREWRHLEETEEDPWAAIEARSQSTPSRQPVADGRTDVLRDRWIAACLAFDESAVNQCAREAFALYTEETAILEVLLPALRSIGERWLSAQVTLQQEHFASVMLARLIEGLVAAAPAPTRPGRVLLACPEGETHGLPLEVLVLLLRRRGCDVVSLGTDVPKANLDETVAAVRPALVVLSAQHLASAAALMRTAASLGRKGILVAFGGSIFNRLPDLRHRIAGIFTGETLLEAADAIVAMLRRPPVTPPLPRPRVHRLAKAFLEARSRIELEVRQELSRARSTDDNELVANDLLGRSLAGALQFGSAAHLAVEIDAVAAGLKSRGMRAADVSRWMEHYARALQRVIGQDAAEIAGIVQDCALRQSAGRKSPTEASLRE